MLFIIQFNNANVYCGLLSFDIAQSGRWVPTFRMNEISVIINNNFTTALSLCR
jgi:hypothetical protein